MTAQPWPEALCFWLVRLVNAISQERLGINSNFGTTFHLEWMN
uniref:Uncharacterized protein n=1 Tax=Anguilla anguilla TaxID=7936 RepID=A0A0E9RZ92_ANGAN